MTYAGPQHYHVKVRVYNESIDFGKGVAELLQRIEATGSLSAAYKAMGMSASKAWKILRRAEADLGFALVSSTAGGKSGGSSVLTPGGTFAARAVYSLQCRGAVGGGAGLRQVFQIT